MVEKVVIESVESIYFNIAFAGPNDLYWLNWNQQPRSWLSIHLNVL